MAVMFAVLYGYLAERAPRYFGVADVRGEGS